MIRALQRKFVFINMLLIAVVLLIVFSIIVGASYQRILSSNARTLQRVITRDAGTEFPPFEIGHDAERGAVSGARPQMLEYKPTFLAIIAQDGSLTRHVPGGISVGDELLQEAVARATAAKQDTGLLYPLSLRYLRRADADGGMRIAFVDVSGDINSLANTLLTLLLVGVLGMGTFLLISIFLARWALRPVGRAWEQQRQFVADASHELKTPLTVILANTEILLAHGGETIENSAKWLENTRDEGLHMKGLVEDMLSLARADADRVVSKERVNVSDLLYSSVLSFEPVAFERGVTLQTQVDESVMALGDAAQLQRLFGILLDNAIKYAQEKTVVTLSLARVQEHTVFRINNRGEAISSADLTHIFERFYRADKARGAQNGYGLGLSIAQAIVRAHGGTIQAESTDRAGTTFTVTL